MIGALHRRQHGVVKFVSELKRRNVFRTAALYAVAAWLVILGFPVILVLAWFFDITRHGIIKDAGAPPPTAEGGVAGPAKSTRRGPSIAVLSFDDMSPDKDQEYLCDGIAEEID